jgi:carbonic anhydrase
MSQINGFAGRRNFLKLLGIGGASIAATAAASKIILGNEEGFAEKPPTEKQATTDKPKKQSVSPQEALTRMVEGNKRFVEGKRLSPNQSKARLLETAVAQYPFAAILGCADSRVPAEMVFDQGLGDLFVVRVAGNIASQTAIGSLEFSTAVLGAQLIVVLGHSQCGAVKAAVKGDPLPGRIGVFVEEIKPAVETVRLKTGDLENNSIIANVQYQAQQLAESSTIIGGLVKEGKLKIVGATYDLASGKVKMLS